MKQLLTEYIELETKANELKKALRPIDASMRVLKRKIEAQCGTNIDKIVEVNDVWKRLHYKNGARKVDFDLLTRFLSVAQYKQVVSTTTYFSITKASLKDIAAEKAKG